MLGVSQSNDVIISFEMSHRLNVFQALKSLAIDEMDAGLTSFFAQLFGLVANGEHPCIEQKRFFEHGLFVHPVK